MSVLEIKQIHKFFKIKISTVKYAKDTNSDVLSLQLYKNSPYKITISLEILGYC